MVAIPLDALLLDRGAGMIVVARLGVRLFKISGANSKGLPEEIRESAKPLAKFTNQSTETSSASNIVVSQRL
jgi:hypothetical protein